MTVKQSEEIKYVPIHEEQERLGEFIKLTVLIAQNEFLLESGFFTHISVPDREEDGFKKFKVAH